jgi:hypothetical protein
VTPLLTKPVDEIVRTFIIRPEAPSERAYIPDGSHTLLARQFIKAG